VGCSPTHHKFSSLVVGETNPPTPFTRVLLPSAIASGAIFASWRKRFLLFCARLRCSRYFRVSFTLTTSYLVALLSSVFLSSDEQLRGSSSPPWGSPRGHITSFSTCHWSFPPLAPISPQEFSEKFRPSLCSLFFVTFLSLMLFEDEVVPLPSPTQFFCHPLAPRNSALFFHAVLIPSFHPLSRSFRWCFLSLPLPRRTRCLATSALAALGGRSFSPRRFCAHLLSWLKFLTFAVSFPPFLEQVLMLRSTPSVTVGGHLPLFLTDFFLLRRRAHFFSKRPTNLGPIRP